MLNDFVHILKCVRNNWESEAQGIIEFRDVSSGKILQANWRDVIRLYRSEEDKIVRRTNLTHEACFPTNIEKINVNLALQVS